MLAAAWAGEPLGINLENYAYPYPIAFLPLDVVHHPVRLAYMDVAPTDAANGKSVLLLHGRNFPASYWSGVIAALAAAGFRVIAPDHLGFGKSSKPLGPWSFDDAAAHTASLLDALGIAQADVVGHSLGGMLAVRFARTYPARVRRLVLEAPLGLEDYRFYVPPIPVETLLAREMRLTGEEYYQYLVNSYGLTLSCKQVMPFVEIRERMKESADYPRWVEAYVATYFAIWGQPTVHELPLVQAPTLFLVGSRDRTAPGRPYAAPADRERMGHIAELA